MENKGSKNIRLGLMVVIGAALLIIGMYAIGDKRNLFTSTFEVSAYFKNVNGLMVGNNVRFSGINVGTVEKIEIVNDSLIRVDMAIELESKKFIKKNAVASIGTDGLMGNKLINIDPSPGPAAGIEEGDFLSSAEPLETDAVLRQLTSTVDDISVIAKNLRTFTETLKSPNSTWSLLNDTVSANLIKRSIVNIHVTSLYSASASKQLSDLLADIRSGKGTIGELLTDTTFITSLNYTMANLQVVSDSLIYFSEDLNTLSGQMLDSEGAFQTIVSDSAFNQNLQETMKNLEAASKGLEENMEALKHNFLLRHYYRKKNHQQEKQKKQLD